MLYYINITYYIYILIDLYLFMFSYDLIGLQLITDNALAA